MAGAFRPDKFGNGSWRPARSEGQGPQAGSDKPSASLDPGAQATVLSHASEDMSCPSKLHATKSAPMQRTWVPAGGAACQLAGQHATIEALFDFGLGEGANMGAAETAAESGPSPNQAQAAPAQNEDSSVFDFL
ncbi:hypothetical protein WJX75_007850 [Coccomyxa subellipsoidea]|jgi:hypothetical protein|uniref:Uncharacterized protein n=1 Tax=Coccomyxa subellipsoidea TaxID=248742 RepID=A0ABR2Z4J6_9CHLO